jgi:hypothetical protein
MKKKLQDSHEYNGNHGRGVFASGRKWACEPKKTSKHPRCQRKTVGELEKRTCNPVEQEENHKNAYAGRGQETIWEMSVKNYEDVVASCCKPRLTAPQKLCIFFC